MDTSQSLDRNRLGEPGSGASAGTKPFTLRGPGAKDGHAVHELISACPPLDLNSRYCYLLQCTDFARTCILAERDDRVVAWVSGYRRPADASVLFIWQVAVHPEARGHSLAKTLLTALLARPDCRSVATIQTSVTADNLASLRVFESLAASLDARFVKHKWLEREAHFQGHHDTEYLLTIGPFETPRGP